MKRNKITNERGFSLMELLIVMVILGLLAALVGPTFWRHESRAKLQSAKSQISLFETAIDTYRLEVGKFPTTDQGLQALRARPQGVEKWGGPYLPKNIPPDPWENAYDYKSPGEHGDYDIISYGADGQSGGEGEDQDVVNWKNIGE